MPRAQTARVLVEGIEVEVVRKDIRNLHLRVYPPHGRVRLTVPRRFSDEAVRLAVIGKLPWIERHRLRFAGQQSRPELQMISGESHRYQGRSYLLEVLERPGVPSVRLRDEHAMELSIRPGTPAEKRLKILESWYRARIKAQVPALLETWQPRLGVEVSDWGVRLMKTRWGSCNTRTRKIWLNLELAKKSAACLEYVVVHELVHLLERRHDARFRSILTAQLPDWNRTKALLNGLPAGDEAPDSSG